MSLAVLKECAAIADKMRAKARSVPAGDLAARAACYAVPYNPGRDGLDHSRLWPGQMSEFKLLAPGDAERAAIALLLLAIERHEKPTESAAT